MIKVCFIISGFAYSGAEVVLYRYLENNDKIDASFIVLYDKKEVIDKLCDFYGKEKVYTLNFKHNKNTLRFLPWIDINKINNKIDKFIKTINPDIIYCNNTMESMLLSRYTKNTKIPCIAHIHDMKNSIRSFIRRTVTEKSIKLYDKVITVSNATKIQWNMDDMIVIYNGLSKNYFIGNEQKYNYKIKNIGFVGTISKRKGIDRLIGLIEEIKDKDITIHIAYSSIEDNELFNSILEIREEYGHIVKLYNKLNSNDIIDFYDNIDLLIVPSRQDPLPTVVLESMARKTIVIGNNIDGIPEMICNKDLLINMENEKDLASKVKYLLELEIDKLNEYSNEQYNYCQSNFDNILKREKINDIILKLL